MNLKSGIFERGIDLPLRSDLKKYGHKPGAHWIEETKEQMNQALADYRVTNMQGKYGLKVRNKKYL